MYTEGIHVIKSFFFPPANLSLITVMTQPKTQEGRGKIILPPLQQQAVPHSLGVWQATSHPGLLVLSATFSRRQNHLKMCFSEHVPVVKQHMAVFYFNKKLLLRGPDFKRINKNSYIDNMRLNCYTVVKSVRYQVLGQDLDIHHEPSWHLPCTPLLASHPTPWSSSLTGSYSLFHLLSGPHNIQYISQSHWSYFQNIFFVLFLLSPLPPPWSKPHCLSWTTAILSQLVTQFFLLSPVICPTSRPFPTLQSERS